MNKNEISKNYSKMAQSAEKELKFLVHNYFFADSSAKSVDGWDGEEN